VNMVSEIKRVCSKRKRSELASWLNDVKAQKGCESCGEPHIACLDFHYKTPSEKGKHSTMDLAKGQYGKERIEEELAKCEVLCANCRRKRYWELGNRPMEIFSSANCTDEKPQ